MKKKTTAVLILTLLIATAILPASGNNNFNINEIEENFIDKQEIVTTNQNNVDWWPMFRHDPQHSGYSTSTAPDRCNVKWSYKIEGPTSWVGSSPAVVDGRIYFGSWNKKMYCLDANDGNIIWVKKTGNVLDIAPAVVDGKLYITSYHSVLCMDIIDGTSIWEYKAGDEDAIWCSPNVADGRVYIGSYYLPYDYGKVFCLDASNGDEIWIYDVGGRVESSPAVADGKVYFGNSNINDGKLICLNASDGGEIWSFKTSGGYAVFSSPTVLDGKVYFGGWDGIMYCLNANTGTVIWGVSCEQIGSSPAVADGKVYIGSASEFYSNSMYCFNASDGTKIWEYETPFEVQSSPAVADGKIYFGTCEKILFGGFLKRGKVICLNANDGSEIWTYYTGFGGLLFGYIWSSPAIADGKVYIGGSGRGRMYCFSDTLPNAPTITGSTNGKAGESYNYTFTYTEPDGNNVSYYIKWGDGTTTTWTDFQASGSPGYSENHTWDKSWRYTIKAKAKNTKGYESEWGTLKVTMPMNQQSHKSWLFRFSDRFPLLNQMKNLLRQRGDI